jgi:hypothetical protein
MSIRINQLKKLVEVKMEIENPILLQYFDNIPESERNENFFKALYIGVLALKEDRLSAFLSKTTNELGTELESLKIIFDMKHEIFDKTTVKGTIAESDICNFLNEYFKQKYISDRAILTGNTTGLLERNKTGDIICEINEPKIVKIVIECKFDKSVKLGDIESRNLFLLKKTDTAFSQLIEASANRGCDVSMIVFDRSSVDASILSFTENVGYIPEVGFIVIIDSQKADYSNLVIAYMLARNIAVNAKDAENIDTNILSMIVSRIVKDTKEVGAIKNLVESNISNNKEILKQLEKSATLVKFNQDFLKKFLEKGTLTKAELLAFYNAESVNEYVKKVGAEIEAELNQ